MELDRSKKVARNTGLMFLRMLVVAGIGLYSSRVVLRLLGVEDLGIYNLVGTIVVMFFFLQTSLDNATYRFIAYDLGAGIKSNLQKTFSMSLNVEFILAIVIFLLSEVVGMWFIDHKLNIPADRLDAARLVFHFSLLTFVLSLLKTPFNSLILAHERMDYYAFICIVDAILKLSVVFVLQVIPYDKLIGYSILLSGEALVMFLLIYVYCRHFFKYCSYIRYWDAGLLKKLLNYSGLSLVVNACDIAVLQSFGIFFNIFSGVVANAALGIVNQVNGQLNQFLNNFGQSYGPQIIKSYAAGDHSYFMKLVFSSSKLSFFLLFSVDFPLMLNIDYLLRLWLVTPPPQTGVFLCLICCFQLLDSFSQPLWMSVHATGNLKVHQLLMGSIKIMNIPISYTLLKIGFPIVTALVVYVALNTVCTVVRIWWLHHLIGLDIPLYLHRVIMKIVEIVAISIPIPLLLYFSIDDGLTLLLSSCTVFAILFSLSVYFLALNEKEKELLQGALRKVPVLKRVIIRPQ